MNGTRPGRGTFDRGDLKEAAGVAGRAMEPLPDFWGVGAGRAGDIEADDKEGAALDARGDTGVSR